MRRNQFRWPVLGLSVCALFFVTSCADTDTNGVDDGRVPVQFTSQIKRHQPSSEALNPGSRSSEALHPDSRAVDTSWSASDKVGISMIEHEGSLATGTVFSEYQVSGSGGESVTFVPTATDQTLYYPTDGGKVNFLAFSPYVQPSSNTVSYSAFSDQSEQAKMEAVDFLYHKGTTAYSKTDASVMLTFGHKLSKVVVEAVTTDDATAIVLTDLDIQITGMPDGVTASLADGALTASATRGSIAPYVTDVADKRTATAIVVPHNGVSGRTIELSIPDIGVFTHPFADSYNFVSGKEYVLTFTVNRKGATLSGTEINDWVDDSWTDSGSYFFNMKSDKNMSLPINGGTFNIAFETNYPVGVALKYSASATDANAGQPDWITGMQTSMSETAGVVTCSSSFEVGVNVIPRTCYAHVTAGKFATVVTITQGYPVAASANCVMLSTDGASVLIPVSRANEYTDFVKVATPAIGADDAFTTEILWSDTEDLLSKVVSVGTGASGYILVTVASGKAGNAVVAAKVDDTIVWSWHVWVVDYDPDNGGGTYTNTYNTNNNGEHFVFMDRNLGATLAGIGDLANYNATTNPEAGKGTGLFYQWGRKDPFPTTKAPGTTQPGSGSFTAEGTDATKGTIANTIQNPNVFYGGISTSSNDWLFAARDNELWGHSGEKTIYDPCPAGWRVPKNSTMAQEGSPWSGFSKENGGTWSSGWTWGTHAIYPAVGYRLFGSGVLAGVAGTVDYWSASPSSSTSNAISFNFNSGSVNVNSPNTIRSGGSVIRCVKI